MRRKRGVRGYRLKATGYGLWVTGYGLRVTGYGLRVIGYSRKRSSDGSVFYYIIEVVVLPHPWQSHTKQLHIKLCKLHNSF